MHVFHLFLLENGGHSLSQRWVQIIVRAHRQQTLWRESEKRSQKNSTFGCPGILVDEDVLDVLD